MHTLLLADDSTTTQRVVALMFANEAVRVVTVSDGQQALDAMAGVRPDIVLAGTTLSRTNGYELSERMRGIEALRDVPVLLLSGAFESVDAAKLATCGARGVIEKPLETTAVISRVRELLGLTDARPAMPAGRLVTADTAADARKPARPAAPLEARAPQVSSWDELRREAGFEADARPVEAGSGREDNLDTLDSAFHSLDQHLAGRHQDSGASSRNPSALPPPPEAGATNPIFEVDDEWFAEDDRAREASLAQQRDLAAEMGIHDVELPAAEPTPDAPAPAEGRDFEFGLDDLMAAPVAPAPVEPEPPTAPVMAPAPVAEAPPGSVADDFAALLAFETGDGPAPPSAAPVVVRATAPEVTEEMLDQIAQRVVERLNAASFGADLREAMAAAVRETVRSVVSETSERLVRDELARIRARAERDTR